MLIQKPTCRLTQYTQAYNRYHRITRLLEGSGCREPGISYFHNRISPCCCIARSIAIYCSVNCTLRLVDGNDLQMIRQFVMKIPVFTQIGKVACLFLFVCCFFQGAMFITHLVWGLLTIIGQDLVLRFISWKFASIKGKQCI